MQRRLTACLLMMLLLLMLLLLLLLISLVSATGNRISPPTPSAMIADSELLQQVRDAPSSRSNGFTCELLFDSLF